MDSLPSSRVICANAASRLGRSSGKTSSSCLSRFHHHLHLHPHHPPPPPPTLPLSSLSIPIPSKPSPGLPSRLAAHPASCAKSNSSPITYGNCLPRAFP